MYRQDGKKLRVFLGKWNRETETDNKLAKQFKTRCRSPL